MSTSAGASARQGYRRARGERRRAAALSAGLGTAAAAAATGALLVGADRTILLIVAAALALPAWAVRARPDPERWLRGAAGELATARLLDRLAPRRWAVLHDRQVPGSRANIDHIVIGPTGVWMVDSKTTRARVRTGWRSVRLGDRPLDTGPARWEAQVVADRLGADVEPLVVLYGGALSRRGVRCGGVRVIPARGLLRRIRRGRRRLSAAAIGELAARAEDVFRPAADSADKGRRVDA